MARVLVLALLVLVATTRVAAGAVPPAEIPAAARAVPLDTEAATRAYLATVPAEKRAASDAYFEGGYVLQVLRFLLSAAILVALLHTGVSARLRAETARATGVRGIQVALYWLGYLVVTSVLAFPLTIYAGFFREHAYGLSTMSLGAWLADEAKGFAVSAVIGALFVPVLYLILRHARRTWWLWGSAAVIAFNAFGAAFAPVYLAPMFNHYKPVVEESVRAPILSMARANGIAADEVWEFDASRQSNRVSANVSGLFGTQRISLNDNLLERCSLGEIEAAMGHEMGHYVMNHIPKGIFFLGALTVIGFALLRALFDRLRVRFAGRWRVEGIDDPAGLPLISLIVAAYLFVLTPVTNTITRTQEVEADMFGLNAARQPDAMASLALKLGEYRKLDPGALEELVFFDHPSGRARIYAAMRWKAEHVQDR